MRVIRSIPLLFLTAASVFAASSAWADVSDCERTAAETAVQQAYDDMAELGVDQAMVQSTRVVARDVETFFVTLSSGTIYSVGVRMDTRSCKGTSARRFEADEAIDLRVGFVDLETGPGPSRSIEILLPADGEAAAEKAPETRIFDQSETVRCQVISTQVWLEGRKAGWTVLVDQVTGADPFPTPGRGCTLGIRRADGTSVKLRILAAPQT